jgi:hypothetical protein
MAVHCSTQLCCGLAANPQALATTVDLVPWDGSWLSPCNAPYAAPHLLFSACCRLLRAGQHSGAVPALQPAGPAR